MDTLPDRSTPSPRTGMVRVAETRSSPLQVDIQAGPSRFFADEPVSVGGMDMGPTPHELVSAGLGACTAMTMRMYADRKGWPVERIEVDVVESRAAGGPTRFERTIRLHGALDEDQRARLLEIAERCPVHRTLSEGAKIETRLEGVETAATP